MRKLLFLFLALLTSVGTWATDVTVIRSSEAPTAYGSLSGTTFTTNDASGMAGVTIDGIIGTTATDFPYGACLALTSTASGTITMTAPSGYIITGYSLTARSNTYSVSYTLTPSAGGSAVVTSTGGVTLTASGLDAQTASFTYSAASANSFYIPSMSITLLSTSAQTVNVTYELWEGESKIETVTKVQEANSALNVPTSWTSSPLYSYVVEGEIGNTDCTIKVMRTQIGVITTSDLSNDKCYTIRTHDRGWWVVPNEATAVTSTTNAGLATLATDTKQQFAFIYYDDTENDDNDGYYLYSVSAKKFVSKSGQYTTLTEEPGDKVTLLASSGDSNYPTVIAFNGSNQAGISNGYNPAVITFWNDLADGGNRVAICEAADFDATEALETIGNNFHPNYTVTYIVKDGSDNVLFTSDPVGTTNGATITTLPAEYQLTNFYTYNTVDVTISNSGNTYVEFVATPKAEPLLKYTADAANPYYYNLSIRSKYLVYNSEATGEVTLQDESEPFNADASWAFVGEPYAGFKVINKTKGTDYFLTYTSVVTGGNGGSDGSNNNIQFVAAGDFNNRYWIIDKNNGGFVLRMKENTNIYFHHQNISGSNGYLRTCSVSEWSAVHNDQGSTIVASTDEDVLITLYDNMKDYTFGTAIGQYNTTNPSVVTNEQATSTISNVSAAIAASQTAAYADCYAALNTLAANIALVTPTAGYYRFKNVATGEYLTAVKATGYASTENGVFANGDGTSAATVVKLVEKDGKLYMHSQNHSFDWVVADKSQGSGNAWVNANLWDKYANWFAGNAAGQIAFAICYGNGADGYASYLTKGIYTANEDGAVIGGTDYKADAAQWIVEEATSIDVTISDARYATLYVPFAVTIPKDVEAKKGTIESKNNDQWLSLTDIEGTIPAGTPVVLALKEGAKAGTYTFDIADDVDVVTDNDLKGTYLPKAVEGASTYVLANPEEGVGFYLAKGGTIGANKAYLEVEAAGVKGFTFKFGDDATSINEELSVKNESAPIYNLAGQRISKMQKGINIVNGKKILK